MKTLICIPTYNERENLEAFTSAVLASSPATTEILVIDDNSPDGTGALADAIAARNSRVHVLHRAGKLGLATAYLEGFRWGLERDFEWIFEMDADFSHDPAHLPEFHAVMASGKADVVCGSRYVPGGGVSNWSRGRLLLSRAGSLYSELWLGGGIKDWTGGFNVWHRRALARMGLSSLRSKGYAFQIEMKYRALLTGARLIETPIVFRERRAGHSKMSGSIVREAIGGVALLRIRSEFDRLFA